MRFTFNEEFPFASEPDWADHKLESIEVLHADPEIDRNGVGEDWAQPDKYWTKTCWDLIHAVSGD